MLRVQLLLVTVLLVTVLLVTALLVTALLVTALFAPGSAHFALASPANETEDSGVVVETVPIDLWRDPTAVTAHLPLLQLHVSDTSSRTFELHRDDGTSMVLTIPEERPANWRLTAADLGVRPWHIPAEGRSIAWRALDTAGNTTASGVAELRLISATESLDRYDAEIENARDPLAQAALLETAASLCLDLGLPARADRHALALRALTPQLAGRDAGRARRASIAHALIAARIQRTYADADPIHRRASLDRVERLEKAVADDPELSAQCSILLAEAALERLGTTDAGAERRKLLDRARTLARAARSGERDAITVVRAELLWTRVSIARGWRTESEETLAGVVGDDPRIVARVAVLASEVARSASDPLRARAEIERALDAVETMRRHAGSLDVDAGISRAYFDSYLAQIGFAAESEDGLATWWAIEAARPRRAGTARPETAALTAMVSEWGETVTLLACADLGDAVVTVRANAGGISVHRTPTALGVARDRVRALLRARGDDPSAIDWLSERILDPHEGKFTPNVAIAPLGLLRPLPYDALQIGNRRLGEAHVTWTVPGAAAVRADSARPLTDGPVLAFVDPFHDADGDGESDRARLPSTREESIGWREVVGGYSRFEGRAARESRLRLEGGFARLIHLGCHGEFARHRPFDSALLLAAGGGHDGRLTARELATLDLRACALVCLSGCETGLTRAEGGDDLAGFPRAVLESGAGALLGSLWPVDDGTAGMFFRNFHRQLRESGDPRQALRQARLESRLDPQRRSPRHWAPWVLLENFP